MEKQYRQLTRKDLILESRYKGYEVGFKDSKVVELYQVIAYPAIHLYIDVDGFKVLEVWFEKDDDNTA